MKNKVKSRKAMRELARILKPKGIAILTIPGNWRRKQTKIFSHLNYNGHYRDYGLDILNMLRNSFSMVKKIKHIPLLVVGKTSKKEFITGITLQKYEMMYMVTVLTPPMFMK